MKTLKALTVGSVILWIYAILNIIDSIQANQTDNMQDTWIIFFAAAAWIVQGTLQLFIHGWRIIIAAILSLCALLLGIMTAANIVAIMIDGPDLDNTGWVVFLGASCACFIIVIYGFVLPSQYPDTP